MTFWRASVSKSRRWRILAAALVLLVTASIGAHALTARYRIGLSLERVQSLSASHFIVDLRDTHPDRGAYFAFRIPHALGTSFPAGTVFVKRIVAMPGDLVHVGVEATTVNGLKVADTIQAGAHSLNIDPESLVRTFVVPPGNVFVVGTEPLSWDSRYWGPVPVGNLEGRAWLL